VDSAEETITDNFLGEEGRYIEISFTSKRRSVPVIKDLNVEACTHPVTTSTAATTTPPVVTSVTTPVSTVTAPPTTTITTVVTTSLTPPVSTTPR